MGQGLHEAFNHIFFHICFILKFNCHIEYMHVIISLYIIVHVFKKNNITLFTYFNQILTSLRRLFLWIFLLIISFNVVFFRETTMQYNNQTLVTLPELHEAMAFYSWDKSGDHVFKVIQDVSNSLAEAISVLDDLSTN